MWGGSDARENERGWGGRDRKNMRRADLQDLGLPSVLSVLVVGHRGSQCFLVGASPLGS